MLRLFRSRPNLLRFGAFSKAHARTEPQIIRLQRVKIRPKLYRPMALATAAITYATAWYIYSTLTGSVIDRFLANEMADMSLEERKRLKKKLDQVEPFYIPLPGTCRLVDSEPYKSTDPEWKTFVRMSEDHQLIRRLKFELVEIVVAKLSRIPEARPVSPETAWRPRACWLQLHYPYRPAPTYEQKVLSWEPEGLTITTKPVSSLAAGRLSHILWPSALGLSTWTFAKELFKQNLHSTAKFFGFDIKPKEPAHSLTYNKLGWVLSGSASGTASNKSQPLAKSQAKAHGAKDQNALASADTQAANRPETTSEAPTMSPGPSPPPSSSTTTPRASGPDAEAAGSSKAKDLYGVRQISEHTSGPRAAMAKMFKRTFRPARPLPPRGSVYFTGLVQLVNSEAEVTLEVMAFWDPAEKQWWPQMHISMKQAHAKAKPPPSPR